MDKQEELQEAIELDAHMRCEEVSGVERARGRHKRQGLAHESEGGNGDGGRATSHAAIATRHGQQDWKYYTITIFGRGAFVDAGWTSTSDELYTTLYGRTSTPLRVQQWSTFLPVCLLLPFSQRLFYWCTIPRVPSQINLGALWEGPVPQCRGEGSHACVTDGVVGLRTARAS